MSKQAVPALPDTLEVNGWKLFAHPLFVQQLDDLTIRGPGLTLAQENANPALKENERGEILRADRRRERRHHEAGDADGGHDQPRSRT
mgnify:CR=1 FL=1